MKRETHALVLGLEQAGKTLLIRRLKKVCSKDKEQEENGETGEMAGVTNPTTGFDTSSMVIDGRTIYVNEIGSAMISNWHKFVPDAKTILVSPLT